MRTDVERWADDCLLYAAFALVLAVPGAACGAQGEGPDGPRRPYRPGTVVHKQVKITLPAQDFGDTCRATVNLRFTQADNQADVRSEILNQDCAASSGSYQLRLRIKDDNGEQRTLSFSEDWARQNDQPIETRKFYEIGNGVELAAIRVKSASCECTDEPVAPREPQ